jgi:hypothetical protein
MGFNLVFKGLNMKEIKSQVLGRPATSPDTILTELSGFTPVQVNG